MTVLGELNGTGVFDVRVWRGDYCWYWCTTERGRAGMLIQGDQGASSTRRGAMRAARRQVKRVLRERAGRRDATEFTIGRERPPW